MSGQTRPTTTAQRPDNDSSNCILRGEHANTPPRAFALLRTFAALSLLVLLGLATAHVHPAEASSGDDDNSDRNSNDGAPEADADNDDEADLAEQLDEVRRQLILAEGIALEEVRAELERLADAHGLDSMREHLEPWRYHGRQVVRRAAVRVLLGLEAHEAVRPYLSRYVAAGAPNEVAEASFVRLITGVPEGTRGRGFRDRDGMPEPQARYGWLVEHFTDSRTGETVFVIMTADWRRFEYRRAGDAPPGSAPRIEHLAFDSTLRHWIAEAHSGRVPAFEPLYAAVRLLPRPSIAEAQAWQYAQRQRFVELLALLAVNAELRGRHIMAGEAIEAALLLWKQMRRDATAEQGDDANGPPEEEAQLDAPPAEFLVHIDTGVAQALFRKALEVFMLGGEANKAHAALELLAEYLPVASLSFTLEDHVAAFEQRVAYEPLPAAPASLDAEALPAEREAVAHALVERLLEVNLGLTAGPLEVGLGMFERPGRTVRTLLALNVHAVPALLERLDDRRPSRTLLPTVDGVPVAVRLGDLCWHLLRHITGEELLPAEFEAGPVPTLDRHEAVLAEHARQWWAHEAPYRGNEAAYLAHRLEASRNPERLSHLERYLEIAVPEAALEMMMRVAQREATLEATVITHLLHAARTGTLRPGGGAEITAQMHDELVRFFAERMRESESAQTRLRLARHLDAYEQDPTGAALVFDDIEAGRLEPSGYGTWRDWLDWLGEVAAREPGLLPELVPRLALLAHSPALPPETRLHALRYFCEKPVQAGARVPLAWRGALVAALHDRRVVGAETSEMPEAHQGMAAPRWRDHAAALLAEYSHVEAVERFEFDTHLVARDLAAARLGNQLARDMALRWPPSEAERQEETDAATRNVLQRLEALHPFTLSTVADSDERGVSAEQVPQPDAVDRQEATRLLEALLRAPTRETAQRAHERAVQLGPGLYPIAAQMLATVPRDGRERLEWLCVRLANECRRVRVHVYREYHSTSDPSALPDEVARAAGERVLELFEPWQGEPLSASTLRQAFRALEPHFGSVLDVEAQDGTRHKVRLDRVDLMLTRLPRGRGSVAEISVTLAAAPHDDNETEEGQDEGHTPTTWVRLGVVVNGDVRSSRAVETQTLQVLEILFHEPLDGYNNALNRLEERVEARLTLTQRHNSN